jgi:mycoredoxin-dependent peroxiredoxin
VVGRPADLAQVKRRQTVIGVGQEAPDFTLRDQNNEVVSLSAFRGTKAVLVIFYPAAFSPTCTGELGEVRDNLDVFQNDAVQVVSIDVDSVYANKIFSERERFTFPLLSDFWPHGATAMRYGVFNSERGFANRGTFLVDSDGIVRFAEMNGPGEGRDAKVWRAAIDQL